MECALCYGPTLGLKTVQCPEPCSAIYCSKCWPKMTGKHKIYCAHCTRRLPAVLSKSDKKDIRFIVSLIVGFITILIILYPYVPFKQISKCEMQCPGFSCNSFPELCKKLTCSLGVS